MKRIEIEILPPEKLHWELVIMPNITFGYHYDWYVLYIAWFLWGVMITIKKK